MPAINTPVLLDMDEGIDVRADVQRTEHRLHRILEGRAGSSPLRRMREGHRETHEFRIVWNTRIELKPEIVDSPRFGESYRVPYGSVTDARKGANRFRAERLPLIICHGHLPSVSTHPNSQLTRRSSGPASLSSYAVSELLSRRQEEWAKVDATRDAGS